MSDNNFTNQTKEEKLKEIKVLKPKNDVVFQRLFNKENEKITKAFVEALLDEKIHKIKINEDKNLLSKALDQKSGILDLQVDVNDEEKVDLEIQLMKEVIYQKDYYFIFLNYI